MPYRRNQSDDALLKARKLRQAMNHAELKMWAALRGSKTGFKFRRQHPFGPYFIDFFCMEANVALELDGNSHENRFEHDARRDTYLREHGIETLRIANSATDDEFGVYLARVLILCEARTGRKGKDRD